MKKLILPILVLAVFVSCTKTTTVTFSVKNGAGDIYCFMPIDHSVTVFATDTVHVASADTMFRFGLQTDEMMYSLMFGPGLGGNRIQTVLGDDFSISVDLKDPEKTIRFDGKNAAGRDLYHRLSTMKNIYEYEWVRDFSKVPLDTSAVVMRANLDKIARDEIVQFDTLRQNGEIDRRFYDFVKADIELYYKTVLSKVIASKYVQDRVLFSDYGDVWGQVFEQQPITPEIFCYGIGDDYTNVYLNHYIPYKKQIDLESHSFEEYMNFRARMIDENIADPLARQRYRMHWLFSMCLNNKTYEKLVVDQLEKYMNKFPESDMNACFAGHKQVVERYYEIVASDFSPGMNFVDNYQQIKSFRELLDKFSGRKVFIDLWFSTCGPCVQEFGHTRELKKFLRDQDIDMLYISIDAPELEEKWQNAIKYYELDGFHIRTSKELHIDLYEKYGVGIFPTYMIVNENGEIVERNAKNPSSGRELIDQISAKLEL